VGFVAVLLYPPYEFYDLKAVPFEPLFSP